MSFHDSKSYQLRVRVTEEERNQLDALRAERARGETISDLVREAIALLILPEVVNSEPALKPELQTRVEHLAQLLKRQPRQVEESCVEGILDLIEHKCEVPLIVMETHLHLKYHGRGDKSAFPWAASDEGQEAGAAIENAPSA